MTLASNALLVARSLVVYRKEALPHVNDLPVHLVACVRINGRVLEVIFIQYLAGKEGRSPRLGCMPSITAAAGWVIWLLLPPI